MVRFSFWVVHPSHSLAEGQARKLIVSAHSHAWQFGYPDVDSCFILFCLRVWKYITSFNDEHKKLIIRTLIPGQPARVPLAADLLTSSWHLHEAEDMLLCILGKSNEIWL